MKMKYLSIVRRTGRNRAIVAIARILVETIYVMLSKGGWNSMIRLKPSLRENRKPWRQDQGIL
jgi:hypothetical protein